MEAQDYKNAFYALLPPGEAWPEQPGEFPEFDKLANALAPSLVDADANAQGLITEAIITETTQLIANWEEQYALPDQYSVDGATLEQRRADIVAKRRKRTRPNIYLLGPVVNGIATGSTLTQHNHPPFSAGVSGSGDACGDSGMAVWSLEYMKDILDVPGDDLEDWDRVGTITEADDVEPSPMSSAFTMDVCTFAAGAYYVNPLNTAQERNVRVRFTMWARTPDDVVRTLSIQYLKRDNTLSTALDCTICGTWAKLVYEAEIGVGATAPEVRLISAAGGDYTLGEAFAGEHYPELEGRITQLFPINTSGEFLVVGEGPVLVYDDSGNLILTDEGDPVIL